MKTNRLVSVDVLRAIAIVLMVQVHFVMNLSPREDSSATLHEKLLPEYVDLAAKAETNKEFLQVVSGYFNLIGATGHGYLLPEDMLLHYMLESLVTGAKSLSDLPWGRFWEARYWAKLQSKGFSHAPFRITREGDKYFTSEDWSYWGKRIPEGSQIVAVNGMSCSEYKGYLKKETALRYVAGNADKLTEPLLVMNEGKGFRGWNGFSLTSAGNSSPRTDMHSTAICIF